MILFHLLLGLTNKHLPFRPTDPHSESTSHLLTACCIPFLSVFNQDVQMVCNEEYKLLSIQLCSFLQLPVSYPLFSSSILFNRKHGKYCKYETEMVRQSGLKELSKYMAPAIQSQIILFPKQQGMFLFPSFPVFCLFYRHVSFPVAIFSFSFFLLYFLILPTRYFL